MIVADHKLIWDLRSDRTWLYDLAADPEERIDLTGRLPQRAHTLRALLRRWQADNRPAQPRPPLELDPAEEARLRALGYLGDEG